MDQRIHVSIMYPCILKCWFLCNTKAPHIRASTELEQVPWPPKFDGSRFQKLAQGPWRIQEPDIGVDTCRISMDVSSEILWLHQKNFKLQWILECKMAIVSGFLARVCAIWRWGVWICTQGLCGSKTELAINNKPKSLETQQKDWEK